MRAFLILAPLVMLAACGGTSEAARQAATEVAEVFLIALRDARWQTAYQRLDVRLRAQCGTSPDTLGRRVIDRFETRLAHWRLRVDSAYRDNVVLTAEVAREEREPVEVGLVAEDDGQQWRITLVEVDGHDLCAP